MSITTKLTYYTERSDHQFTFPARFEVCGRCSGTGKHVNPAIDGNGLSPDDPDLDDDFWEGYFEGRYDVRCECCNGERVVAVVDEARLTPWQRRKLALYNRQRESFRETDRMQAAERAMGA